MKKQFLFISLFAATLVFAQAPQLLNYQGVARNNGSILSNTFVKLRFTIHDANPNGTIIFQETQAGIPTNTYGLFTAQIGSGTTNSGAFNTINWSAGAKYLQVEMDPSNGSTFTDLGTTQLVSVPYALQANKADTAKYAMTSPVQPVTITAGPGVTVSGTYPNFTVTTKDTSATNELQTLSYDTANHSLTLANGNSVSLNDLVPAGTIVAYGAETPPTGWLECNGAAVSATVYPRLFAAIGSNYGNPSIGQFNLPDLRGNFARGWSHGTGQDPDASSRGGQRPGALSGDHLGSYQVDAFKSHTHPNVLSNSGSLGTYSGNISQIASQSIYNTGASGGNETRPRNLNVMYIIKY